MSLLHWFMREAGGASRRSKAENDEVREKLKEGIDNMLAGYLGTMGPTYGRLDVWLDRLQWYELKQALYALEVADRFYMSRPPTLSEIDKLAWLCSICSESACTKVALSWLQNFAVAEPDGEMAEEPFLVTICRMVKREHEAEQQKEKST